jgi:hypothetical protein
MRLSAPDHPAAAGGRQDIESVSRVRRAAVRIACAVLLSVACLVVAGGLAALVLVTVHGWPAGYGFLAFIWCVAATVVCIGACVFWAYRIAADPTLAVAYCLAGACVFSWGLSVALALGMNMQMLHDRGVREQVVVVAENVQCVSIPEGGCSNSYTYTLRSIAGPPIRPDQLSIGSPQLTVGQKIAVLADPRGQITPSLTISFTALGYWIASIVLGGIEAVFLIGLAWTATWTITRPGSRSS